MKSILQTEIEKCTISVPLNCSKGNLCTNVLDRQTNRATHNNSRRRKKASVESDHFCPHKSSTMDKTF